MTWTERVKLAWTTFKREALPLYGWTLIFVGIGVVLLVAMFIGIIAQLRGAFPQASGESFSPLMPNNPVMPPKGLFEPSNGFFDQYSSLLSNSSALIAIAGSIVGVFFLIYLVAFLISSIFYAGQFNLTAKAYREKVSFGDFRISGFLRILGWQVILFLIYLIFSIIGLIVAFALKDLTIALVAFLIVYGLFLLVLQIYTLPWLATSVFYLLAHREQGFFAALRGSWRFFRRHIGALWGYVGTVILIQIALLLLLKISVALGYIASLVVSPFIMVLAIVWVLSLDDDERKIDVEPQIRPTTYPTAPSPETQATITEPPTSVSHANDNSALQSKEPTISLQKAAPLPPSSEDKI